MSALRQELVKAATEAGDLELAAWVATQKYIPRQDVQARLNYYRSH